MIKLSQRAWNNVLIVSMLTLIMLFNFSSNFLNGNRDGEEEIQRLIPPNALISTIEFKTEKIERVGQGWRIKSTIAHSIEPQDIVTRWQDAEITLFDQHFVWLESFPKVQLWFIGQADPIIYQFAPLADKTLVRIDGQTYQLTKLSYQMLTLSE